MHIDDLRQSRFLKQSEVDPPVTVTIVSCDEVNVAKEGADPEMRYALTFKELDKPMTLNSTNGQIIAAITGSSTSEGWIGKRIVLYRDPNISFGAKLVGGIRCRAPQGGDPNPDYEGGDPADIPEF